jgi:hypothetical protein
MATLEELQQRLSVVEAKLDQLLAASPTQPGPYDWQRSLGMFTGDEGMRRIMEEAMRLREQDREAALHDPNYHWGV